MAVTVFPPVQVGVEVGIYPLGDGHRGVECDISFATRIPEQGFSVLTPKDSAVHAEFELLIGAKAIRPIDPCLFVGFTEFEPFVLLSITTQYPFMLLAFEGMQPLDACIGTPAVPPLELRPWRISVHRVEHIDFGQRHGLGRMVLNCTTPFSAEVPKRAEDAPFKTSTCSMASMGIRSHCI